MDSVANAGATQAAIATAIESWRMIAMTKSITPNPQVQFGPGISTRAPSIMGGPALVAQRIEHQLAELGVGGSNPLERATLLT